MRKLSLHLILVALVLLTGMTAEAFVTAQRAVSKSTTCDGIQGCAADLRDNNDQIVATVTTSQDGTTVTVAYNASPRFITEIFLRATDASDLEVYNEVLTFAPPTQTHEISFDVAGLAPGECLNFETYIEFRDLINDPPLSADDLADLELPDQVTMQVAYPGTGGDGPSYFDTTVTNGGALDGTYDGWCVDTDRSIATGSQYTANVYSSYESLPPGLVEFPENFGLVNWILNQNYPGTSSPGGLGTYTFCDVQRAIWALIDDAQYPCGTEGSSWTQARVDEILAAASLNGYDFVPQCAQTVAVVLVPVDANNNPVGQIVIAQVTVIEIPLTCDFEERSTQISFCCCLDTQTIELVKVWKGTAGTTTLTIEDGSGAVLASAEASGQGATTGAVPVSPGTYYVHETDPGTAYETELGCVDGNGDVLFVDPTSKAVEVANGDAVVCTYVNMLAVPTAKVQKITKPEGFESGWTFQLFESGNAEPLETVVTSDAGVAVFSTELTDGSYEILEVGQKGWTSDGGSEGCSFTVTLPADKNTTYECVYTNTAEYPTAKVQKITIPDGFQEGWQFQLFTSDGQRPLETVTTDSSGHAEFTTVLETGSYSIVEVGQDGWTGDGGSVECSFEVTMPDDAGRVFSCTYTNTKDASITIIKNAIGGDGTFSYTSDFGLESLTTMRGTASATYDDLKPNTYTVSETVPDGWDLTSLVCEDPTKDTAVEGASAKITLDAGESVTCTYTNTADKASARVRKVTVPDGSEAGWEFKLMSGGQVLDTVVTTGAGYIAFNTPLGSGSYSIVETEQNGWTNEGGVGCEFTVTLPADSNKVFDCTYTNTEQGKIIVEKQTLPDGSTQLFDFTTSYSNPFQLMDGQQNDSGPLAPGTYSVSENVPAGWTLQSAVCSDGSLVSAIDLSAGETVTCTFTNEMMVVVEGCTLTQGYWKTHADPGKKQYDPTWDLIEPNGPLSIFFLSGQTYLEVMKANSRAGVYYILAQQYIAAVLNGLNGASYPIEVQNAIDQAEVYFNNYGPDDEIDPIYRAQLIALSELLDDYNNGYLGVPHCDD